MRRVEVQRICSWWVLMFISNDQVNYAYTDKKLINVLDVANSLQVHIDNNLDLPIKQYLTQTEGY
jgi:hypothetical protein